MQALFFDLDNTLLNRDVAFAQWSRDWLATHSTPQDPLVGVERLFALDRRARTPREVFFGEVGKLFRCNAGEVREHFFARVPRLVTLYDGVPDLLNRLSSRYRIAAVTNGTTASQRTKMQTVGLDLPAFVSEEVGFEKPAPQIFEAALRWAECSPADALFIGDDPERDIVGAAEVGLRTCWVSNGEPWPADLRPPDWTIERIDQLEECLRCWT